MEDEELLAALRTEVGRRDPVPPVVDDAARAAFTWRTIDAELAELEYDSQTESEELAGVRSVDTGPRLLSFVSGPLTVEVQVTGSGAHRSLVGQVDPGAAVAVEIRTPSSVTEVVADDLGRFQVQGGGGRAPQPALPDRGRSHRRDRLADGVAVTACRRAPRRARRSTRLRRRA